MKRTALIALAVVGGIVGGAAAGMAGSPAPALHRSSAATAIDPGNFVRQVTNPYFPLRPGTLLVYRGVKDGKVQIDRVFVTDRTKTILGIHATVVRDIARRRGGKVLEKTFDWYAQDRQGNVWYLGENTKSFESGHVSTEGSWKAGEHGARAGIVMEADPRAATAYRQEFWKGHAEDQAWVVKRGGTVRVPLRKLHHKLVTFEWARLEPGVIDKKVYARGFGIVQELSQTGPKETSLLVRVHRPGR
jgi:hypothetical protein